MSRLWTCTGVCLLLLSSYGSVVWCYEDTAPYTVRRPLDTLFRAGSSPQKHVGPVPALGLNGSGSHAAHDSHGSLANDQQHQAQRQLSISGAFQPVGPLEQHRAVGMHRGVEPGGPTGNHHRWHADQRPDVFGVGTLPAFQRALPAIDIGSPGSEDDFIGHGGQPPLEMFEPPAQDSALDPTDNEIGDNPLLAALGAISGPRVVDHEEMPPNQPTGRMMESIDLIREQLERIKQEEDIEIKSNLLMKLLTELPEGPLPIVYIEDAAGKAGPARRVTEADEDDTVDDGASDDDDVDGDDGQLSAVGGKLRTEPFTPNGGKRSGRYYRRYPWKRQNARSRPYDAEARYLCVPSREDVFKLLVGLHENRIGNHQKTVNFCNRKRPAKAIFTNIRFLG
uniref:Secreted protein n=1 Tax=Anopheles minimus TaxID=112268 RepID=A0A182WHE6_9DIPT